MTQLLTAPEQTPRTPSVALAIPEMVDTTRLWMLGVTVEDDGTADGPGIWHDSYSGECQCPGICPRDHENE